MCSQATSATSSPSSREPGATSAKRKKGNKTASAALLLTRVRFLFFATANPFFGICTALGRSAFIALLARGLQLLALWLHLLQTLLLWAGYHSPNLAAVLDWLARSDGPPPPADHPQRIRVVERRGRRILALGDDEVVVVGGNYVLKAAPWFPPPEDVARDCRAVVANLARGSWRVPGKRVVPCWRLGCLWSGAMPSPGRLDPEWVARLEETVSTFEAHGIYCFLEVHQDAMCATNGGEGVPVWVAQHFQARPETAAGESYLVSPSHPLEIALPRLLQPLWGRLVSVQTSGEEDPWRAFSVEDEAPGRPATLMNLGNPSIRLNNYGESWRSGVLFLSKQVQSLLPPHLLGSPHMSPYLPISPPGAEPRLAPLPLAPRRRRPARLRGLRRAARVPRRRLEGARQRDRHRDAQRAADGRAVGPLHRAAVAAAPLPLRAVALPGGGARRARRARRVSPRISPYLPGSPHISPYLPGVRGVPVCVTDVGQALPGFSLATLLLALCDPIPWAAWRTYRRWAAGGRLLLSFHYYAPPTSCSFASATLRARAFAQLLSGSAA